MYRMNYLRFLIIGSLVLALFSCGTKNHKITKLEIISNIDTLEYQVYKAVKKPMDNRAAKRLITSYINYATTFPKDTMAVKYWFKAAQSQVDLGNSLGAIKSLDSLVVNYPNSKIAPSAWQFMAFIYDDRLGNINMARACLDSLIYKYPNNKLVNNAKAYKQTLGKSPEEIILEMENKVKNSKDKASKK